jgi:hypothetical protein
MIGRAAHGIAVAVSYTMAFVNKIKVSVYLQDVNLALIVKRVNARNVDGMVAADDHWQGSAFQGLAHRMFDVGVGFYGVGMDDVSVTHIDDVYVCT